MIDKQFKFLFILGFIPLVILLFLIIFPFENTIWAISLPGLLLLIVAGCGVITENKFGFWAGALSVLLLFIYLIVISLTYSIFYFVAITFALYFILLYRFNYALQRKDQSLSHLISLNLLPWLLYGTFFHFLLPISWGGVSAVFLLFIIGCGLLYKQKPWQPLAFASLIALLIGTVASDFYYLEVTYYGSVLALFSSLYFLTLFSLHRRLVQ